MTVEKYAANSFFPLLKVLQGLKLFANTHKYSYVQ